MTEQSCDLIISGENPVTISLTATLLFDTATIDLGLSQASMRTREGYRLTVAIREEDKEAPSDLE